MRGREHRPAILLPVLLCLALGVACAYASSVVCVLLPDRGQHSARESARHNLPGDMAIRVTTLRRPGYMLTSATDPMPASMADEFDKTPSWKLPLRPGDPRPGWLVASAIQDRQRAVGIAAGWPFLCVWGRTDHNVNHDPQAKHTGLSHVTIDQTTQAKQAFPWIPLWFGLAGNMVLYGGVLLIMWFALVWLHRRWRRWRGRCPNCAYPMQDGVAVCPECGMPLQPAATGSSNFSVASSTSSRQTTSTLTSKSSSNDDK